MLQHCAHLDMAALAASSRICLRAFVGGLPVPVPWVLLVARSLDLRLLMPAPSLASALLASCTCLVAAWLLIRAS